MASKKLTVSELEAGMVVAAEITDPQGRPIVPLGGRITPIIIKRLPKWGIESVLIQEVEKDADKPKAGKTVKEKKPGISQEDEEFVKRVALGVIKRFSRVEETPFNKSFRKNVVRCLVLHGRGAVPGL